MDVYKITNLINNKIYIGKTKRTIEIRFKEHINKALLEKNKSNMPICRAIYKYGKENFKIESLYNSNDIEKINEKEDFFIKEYRTNENEIGYNVAPGGVGIFEFSEETKIKISENAKKRIKEKNSFFGKHHSKEQRKKWSLMRKGSIGKPLSEKTKQILSEKFKKRWKNKEFKEMMIKKMKEHPPKVITGEGNKRNIKVKCIELNMEFASLKIAQDELNKMFPEKNFSRSNISNVCRGKKRTHNSFTFEFVDKSNLNKQNNFNKTAYSSFKKVQIIELNKIFKSKKECSDFLLGYTGEKYHEKYIQNDKKYKQFTFKIL